MILDKILICGSRGYNDYGRFKKVVLHYIKDFLFPEIIHGGCYSGADALADKLISEYKLMAHVYPADWSNLGKRAGAIRNKKMVDEADYCIAFWDGVSKGTKITIDMARKKGIPVFVVDINKQ